MQSPPISLTDCKRVFPLVLATTHAATELVEHEFSLSSLNRITDIDMEANNYWLILQDFRTTADDSEAGLAGDGFGVAIRELVQTSSEFHPVGTAPVGGGPNPWVAIFMLDDRPNDEILTATIGTSIPVLLNTAAGPAFFSGNFKFTTALHKLVSGYEIEVVEAGKTCNPLYTFMIYEVAKP